MKSGERQVAGGMSDDPTPVHPSRRRDQCSQQAGSGQPGVCAGVFCRYRIVQKVLVRHVACPPATVREAAGNLVGRVKGVKSQNYERRGGVVVGGGEASGGMAGNARGSGKAVVASRQVRTAR